MNISRKKVQAGKYKRAEAKLKRSGLKVLKQDLMQGGDEKKKFKAANAEAIHLHAGGRSRINEYKETVTKNEEIIFYIVGPTRQFLELFLYKERFGDPKTNKAKVVTRTVLDDKDRKKKVQGCYVLTGTKGEHTVESR